MKKYLKYVVLMFAFLLVPLTTFAEEDVTVTSGKEPVQKEKINVYVFRGEGCPHCEDAITFFKGLDEETKNYFNLVDYETWYNTDNANLMSEVASYLKDKNVSGVPYIVIGKKTYNGFDVSFKNEIIANIKDLYNSENPYDAIESMKNDQNKNSTIIGVGAIVIIAVFVLFIVFSRSNNKQDDINKDVKENKTKIKKDVKKKK